MQAGKARVLRHLIVPLQDVMRLKRPKRVSEAQHLAGLGEMQARLAYLGEAELVALREAIVATLTEGAAWPAPAVVIQMASAICRPPPDDSPMVRSYLGSVAGRDALAGGYHVELWRWLKDKGRPPMGEPDWRAIRAMAAEGARERARLAELRDRGVTLSSGEAARLDGHVRAEARVVALIEAGRAKCDERVSA